MEQKQIDEIKARCEAATPAPWNYFYKQKYNEHHVSVPAYEGSGLKMALFPDGCPSSKNDAEFIAHAREDIPQLIEANEQLQNVLERVTAQCECLHSENAEYRAQLNNAIELPCQVGDTLFAIMPCEFIYMEQDGDTGARYCPFEDDCEYKDCEDTHIRIFKTRCEGISMHDFSRVWYFSLSHLSCEFTKNDIGKTVFLTREDAEKALSERL